MFKPPSLTVRYRGFFTFASPPIEKGRGTLSVSCVGYCSEYSELSKVRFLLAKNLESDLSRLFYLFEEILGNHLRMMCSMGGALDWFAPGGEIRYKNSQMKDLDNLARAGLPTTSSSKKLEFCEKPNQEMLSSIDVLAASASKLVRAFVLRLEVLSRFFETLDLEKPGYEHLRRMKAQVDSITGERLESRISYEALAHGQVPHHRLVKPV